jgi:hypothetical protein
MLPNPHTHTHTNTHTAPSKNNAKKTTMKVARSFPFPPSPSSPSSSPSPPLLTIHLYEDISEEGAFGLFVWQASRKLALFLFKKYTEDASFFRGKRIIELGAG